MELQTIYILLKKNGFTNSAHEFSELYLGMSPKYFSILKSRGSQPSLKALMRLEVKLMALVDTDVVSECLERVRYSKEEILAR